MADIDATTPQLKAIMVMSDSFRARDLRDFEALLSKDWVFTTYPKVPELPGVGKEEYLQLYKTLFSSFTKVDFIICEAVDAPGKTVTHYKFILTTHDGRDLEYTGVAIFTFVEEDGEVKFLDCKDFCDPQKRTATHAEVARVQGNAGFAA